MNCTLAQMRAHESSFIVLSSFHNLTTCISLAAMNGTKGGQHRQVSRYLVQQSSVAPNSDDNDNDDDIVSRQKVG